MCCYCTDLQRRAVLCVADRGLQGVRAIAGFGHAPSSSGQMHTPFLVASPQVGRVGVGPVAAGRLAAGGAAGVPRNGAWSAAKRRPAARLWPYRPHAGGSPKACQVGPPGCTGVAPAASCSVMCGGHALCFNAAGCFAAADQHMCPTNHCAGDCWVWVTAQPHGASTICLVPAHICRL